MTLPILSPGQSLSPDLLDPSVWYEYGATSGHYHYQVPPEPHPWAYSAFQQTLHFKGGSSLIRLEAELSETIPAGTRVKVLCWVYNLVEGNRPGQLQLSNGTNIQTRDPAASTWQKGWNLISWTPELIFDTSAIRVARVTAAQSGHAWWSGLTVIRHDDQPPELARMIQAQRDQGKVI